MQKGKLGFSLWFYPIVALWCIILEQFIPIVMIAGFAFFVERETWVIKQCMTVLMFSIYYTLYNFIMGFFIAIPLLGFVFSIVDLVIWIIVAIFVILSFGKVKNGQDASLPGKGLAQQAFGMVGQQPQYQQPQYQQPQQQYQQPQYQQPQQQYQQQQYQQPQQPQQGQYQNYGQQQNNQPPQQ